MCNNNMKTRGFSLLQIPIEKSKVIKLERHWQLVSSLLINALTQKRLLDRLKI